MRYRKLDANNDMVFGGGQAAYWIDVPDAPAQAVITRLRLWLGQWYLNWNDGTPWQTKILGKYTGATADPAIHERILSTPGVDAILAYSSSLDRNTRVYSIDVTIDTIYGQAQIRGLI